MVQIPYHSYNVSIFDVIYYNFNVYFECALNLYCSGYYYTILLLVAT